jgi:tetratricopeptide (TPR) repeat protein
LAVLAAPTGWVDAGVDSGVIRLGTPSGSSADEEGAAPSAEGRRGFDYDAFDARLEGLWFQRKALVAEGRDEDADRQSDLIRAFCSEEGVRRLEGPAGALLTEADRSFDEGNYERAKASLRLADALDPERPAVHSTLAAILWKEGAGVLAASRELWTSFRLQVRDAWRNLSLVNQLVLVLLLAIMASLGVFAIAMLARYQIPFRHGVEEWLLQRGADRWSKAGGWTVLLLPLLLWASAGWAIFYWIVVLFRHMRRAERATAVALLVAAALAIPGFRASVGLYGLTADPTVRTTLAAASGAYDPDRIVKLRELVEAHPDDPTYRFLLAGLYKNGRYFEEAYDEYKRVLAVAPGTYQAHINIGNIFFLTGQYGEAISHYRQALDIRPDAILAYYDMYLAQSEAFRFKEADESLRSARAHDAKGIQDLVSRGSREGGGRPMVQDASFDLGAIWHATLEGRKLREWLEGGQGVSAAKGFPSQLLNPLSIVSIVAMLACVSTLFLGRGRAPARRCLRCGRPFCYRCKRGRHGEEYCTQCVHLFVLGDGLAPETKTRKLYEVERFDRRNRILRTSASLLLPGSAHLLRGRAGRGSLLVLLWLAALMLCLPGGLLPLQQVLGVNLRLDFLRPGMGPGKYGLDPWMVFAPPLAAATWLVANLGRSRSREA